MTEVETLTAEQSASAARAGRAMLRHALTANAGPALVKTALSTVCSTMACGAGDSVLLLRECLTIELFTAHQYEYLPAMTAYLPQLMQADEQLALDIVQMTAELRESRDDWVPLGGRVLAMRVNKHDLLRMSDQHVKTHFEEVLRARPAFGTKVLFAVIEGHIRAEESRLALGSTAVPFVFRGGQAVVIADRSYVWAAGGGHHEHETWSQVATVFRRVAVELSRSDPAKIDSILATFRDSAKWGILWNQLLLAGSTAGDTLGPLLVDLLCARPILTTPETCVSAGQLVFAAYPHLAAMDRSRIECTILNLAQNATDQSPIDYVKQRDRLLGCIPEGFVESDAARTLKAELDRHGGAPENRPPFEMSAARFMSDDEWLKVQGVPVDEPQNVHFRAFLGDIKRLCANPNAVPSLDVARTFRHRLEEFEQLVLRAAALKVDRRLWYDASHHLYACCEAISRVERLHEDLDLCAYVRSRLLTAATNLQPEPHEYDDEQWDESSAAWGAPLPRIDAAQGLMNLAWHPSTVDGEILGAIERLARDPVNAVRHQIASRLLMLWDTARDLFWSLAEHFTRTENRIAILHFYIEGVLLSIPQNEIPRANILVHEIYVRMVANPKSAPVREACTVFFLRRALWDGDESASHFLSTAIQNPVEKAVELGTAASLCRELLTHDDSSATAVDNARVRQWAFDLLYQAFQSTNRRLASFREEGTVPLGVGKQSDLQTLAQLQERFVYEVYFGSGAFEDKRQVSQHRDEMMDDDRRKYRDRFAAEADTVLETFCQTRLTTVAYTVLETLQHLRGANPRRMFCLVGQLLRSSTADHAHHDSLVADRVVELVEQYLAEDRGLFRDSAMLQTLMDVLDLFVDAGWPKAMLLTYRLDEAIRG
jgi:hypothetical protein